MKKIIKFISNRPWLTPDSISKPTKASKDLPEWYTSANRYFLDQNREAMIGPDGGKVVGWKACPAIYDVMTSGYVYKTPCAIEFYEDFSGKIAARVLDARYQDFLHFRDPMPEFKVPFGYHENHFAWWSDWAVELPKGYSALYTQPLNRFDLPFLTVSGVIDNDNVALPGTMPFFIPKGWTGVLPEGTAYAQIIPFKREDWSSDCVIEPAENLYEKNMENSNKYRIPGGGVYQKSVWQRRKYD